MSPDRDPGRPEEDGHEVDEFEDEPPRSIFSALWFRGLLAVLVLGVLAAVAVPYVLDFATTPALKAPPAKTAMAPTSAAAPSQAAPPPAAPVPAAAPAAPVPVTAAPAPPPAEPAAPAPTPAKPEPSTAKPAPKPPVVVKPPATVAKVIESPKPTPKATAATRPSPTKAAGAAAAGPYWVQVGAFKDAETAKRLVARLREQGHRAEESSTTTVGSRPAAAATTEPSAGDRYDVVVSGASAADVDAKLASKGMTGETTPSGTVVRPSLPLREAVALSRDLADAGLSVQVRRVGGPAPVATPAAAQALHRVRVGGFADRAAAVAALKQLEEKGYKPFIARETE